MVYPRIHSPQNSTKLSRAQCFSDFQVFPPIFQTFWAFRLFLNSAEKRRKPSNEVPTFFQLCIFPDSVLYFAILFDRVLKKYLLCKQYSALCRRYYCCRAEAELSPMRGNGIIKRSRGSRTNHGGEQTASQNWGWQTNSLEIETFLPFFYIFSLSLLFTKRLLGADIRCRPSYLQLV